MKKIIEPTRTDLAVVKVIQAIRSCETLEQLASCKQLVRLLRDNYNTRYLTNKYILLRYKQKLYNITKE